MKFREVTNTKVDNLAGGRAYSQPPEIELISLLLTSFVEDKFYESANSQLQRLKDLIRDIPDKVFVGKAIVYARREFGLRSITHAGIIELLPYVRNTPNFYKTVKDAIYRPDDILEMVGYFKTKATGKKGLPNALRKGINLAIGEMDEYRLAKYRGEGSSVKMVDIFNLTHPKPANEERATLYKKLMTGELKSVDTWESRLSKAGQKGETDEDVKDLKAEAWEDLLRTNKLGYFALLRNLRNIITQSPDSIDLACAALVNAVEIKKSLVFPFRYMTAIKALDEMKNPDISMITKVKKAIDDAMEISCQNVPRYDGITLIVLDCSGSMSGKPIEIGALFASALYKSNPSHLMVFANQAQYATIDPRVPLATMTQLLKDLAARISGGTNFDAIFPLAQIKYDRVIILSDMQGWMGIDTPAATFEQYKIKFRADPYIYSFDLNGHGSMQFKNSKVFCIAGFSDKIFGVMSKLEQDKEALIKTIMNYQVK